MSDPTISRWKRLFGLDGTGAKRAVEANPRTTSRYHAISIAVGRATCREVEALIGARFLAGEAPRLPLRGCSINECRCRYVHHADRRSEGDRRLRDLWRMGTVHAGEDRRNSSGRRKRDA